MYIYIYIYMYVCIIVHFQCRREQHDIRKLKMRRFCQHRCRPEVNQVVEDDDTCSCLSRIGRILSSLFSLAVT